MSWLLFLDESGHYHHQLPYEVRGGTALHVSKIWPFVKAIRDLEERAFGASLSLYRKELKGSTLLDRKRFRFASQLEEMEDAARKRHARAFLTRGLEKTTPSRVEFAAYGQACVKMAEGIFACLQDFDAKIFAAAIPRGCLSAPPGDNEGLLRKDHVFLLERFCQGPGAFLSLF